MPAAGRSFSHVKEAASERGRFRSWHEADIRVRRPAEPDTDSPAGPELVAPADFPDFQLDWACCDDQTANDGDAQDVIVVED